MDLTAYSTESKLSLPASLRFLFWFDETVRSPSMHKDGSLNRRFYELLDFRARARENPVHGVSSTDVSIDKETGVSVRIYAPHETTAESLPVILYFHGGGFALLSAHSVFYNTFCRKLCRTCKAVVMSVEYRRSPEHRYPIAYDDCFSALEWLKDEGQKHLPSHADTSRCFLMGDSAGGNIVHHVACMAAARDLSPLKLIGNVLLFPFFGGEERTPAEIRLKKGPLASLKATDWCWRAYLPEGAGRDHPAANVTGPNARDLRDVQLPASMVVIAGHDLLKDWQLRYVEKLKKDGKEVQLEYYEDGIHSFHLFPKLERPSDLLAKIHQFVTAMPISKL